MLSTSLAVEERITTVHRAKLAYVYARAQGLEWNDLAPARKIALLKSGVQNPREAKDVDALTQAFRERGVQRQGEDAVLIWGRVPGRQEEGPCCDNHHAGTA